MPDDIRYAAYPSAKVYRDGDEVQHLLWGDWVKLTGPAQDGWVPVQARKTRGEMREADLQSESLLEVVFVDVGQGDGCLIVTPDDRKIIIDAGVSDNLYRFLNWRFDFRGGVREFDAAIITHPDTDHYAGFGRFFADDNLRFRRLFHNGIMEQKGDPFGAELVAGGKKFITDLMVTREELEAFLEDEERYEDKKYANLLKKGLARLTPGGEVAMLAASGVPDDPAYVPGYGADRELRLKILSPVPEPDEDGKLRLRWLRQRPEGGSFDTGKTKNGHSVVVRMEYRGVSILLGGDLNSSGEVYLLGSYTGMTWPPAGSNAENTMVVAARVHFGSDVMKCCHHGSADFTDAFLRAVNPAATVVSSGDQESHAHPRCDTLGALGLHGKGWRPLIFSTELARSTREDEGDLREKVGRLREKIEREQDAAKKQALAAELDAVVDELLKRNVVTYGAINLRTDGRKAIFAYKLEKPRINERGRKRSITKWDIYRMEKTGGGPLVYVQEES